MNKGLKQTVMWLSLGMGLLLVGILMVVSAHYYMEYVQIQEIGENFTSVFSKNLLARLSVHVISFLIVFLAIFLSLLRVRKTMLATDESFSFLKPLFPVCLLSFTMAIFAGNFIKKAIGSKFLMYLYKTEWGMTDPIFGQDFSYYVFTRPLAMALLDSFMGIAIFVCILVLVLYVLLYARLGINRLKELIRDKKIITQIIFHFLVIMLIHLCTYKFRAEDILFSEFAGVTGAGFTHVNVWLKYYKIIPYIGALVAVGVLIFLNRNKLKLAIWTALLIPMVLIGFTVGALITQHFYVHPAEVQVEAPYISHHMEATKMAYGITDIATQEFSAENSWTSQDVAEYQTEISRLSILDQDATKTILGQLQDIRDYYEFIDIDTVSYQINGKKEAVMISPRELKELEESPTSQSYSNDKMRFTHGYGVVVLPGNSVTADGLPVLYVKDSPLVSNVSELDIKEPRIYYGEYDDDYSVVNTQVKEFDYLSNGQSVENVYEGKSGIPLNGINRLLFAIRFGDYPLIASNFITAESKLLLNTNVLDRVEKAAPFLRFDEDPYVLTDSQGRLKWIVDAYTVTDKIPYSLMFEDQFNYIRNPAKAVVDAYDGTVKIYITDSEDPLINVYKKLYPDVFSREAFPEDLIYSLRYPETYFTVQAEILKQYHINDVATFYNRSDDWEIAYEICSETSSWAESISPDQTKTKMKSFYQMVTREGEPELNQIIPYTVKGKDNLAGLFLAGSDGDSYGKLRLIEFPQGKTVFGPLQIERRINSNPEIEQVMSAWGSGESTIIRGKLIAVPIADSILYVEPIYVTAGKNTFPEMKMVVVAYGSKIAISPTLQQALEALAASADIEPEPEEKEPPVEELPLQPEGEDLQRITEAFKRVQEASKINDWEEFGKAMKDLETIINELNGILPEDLSSQEIAS